MNIRAILKGLLYAGVLFVMFVPMLQDYTEYKTYIAPLNGSFETAKDTTFNWPAWWEGSYQEQKNRFLKDNFGLHNYYVRLNSQLNFNLFKKANAAYVVVGKDNYLYETGYIDAYHGKDFIGTKKVENYMRQLKQVQDTLASRPRLPILRWHTINFYWWFLRPAKQAFILSTFPITCAKCHPSAITMLSERWRRVTTSTTLILINISLHKKTNRLIRFTRNTASTGAITAASWRLTRW